MLPYGTLWKLDQMLHPAAPPQRRTVALRRRQALFYFLWGVLLVSLFLLPYHYASLRRQRMDEERRLSGAAAPAVDAEELRLQQEHAMGRLTTLMAAHDAMEEGWETKYAPTRATADFATAFYHHFKTEMLMGGVFHHALPRSLAGAGAGTLWGHLASDCELAAATEPECTREPTTTAVAVRRRTVAEAHFASRNASKEAQQASCLASLRRDYLVSRLSSPTDAAADLLPSLRAAVQDFGKLGALGVSNSVKRAPSSSLHNSSTANDESTLARLFLWIADDPSLHEEALGRAVAGCFAPMSRALDVSFEWRAAPAADDPRRQLSATLSETAESQLQYVCLCSGRSSAKWVFLGNAIENGAAAPALFLVDPLSVDGAAATSCAKACM